MYKAVTRDLHKGIGYLIVDLGSVGGGIVASVKHKGDGFPGTSVLLVRGAEQGALVVDLVHVQNVLCLVLYFSHI